MKTLSIALFILVFTAVLGAVTLSVNFDNTNDLTNNFNLNAGSLLQNYATGGLGNSGYVNIEIDANDVATYKTQVTNPPIGKSVSTSVYFYNSDLNWGYGIMGFGTAATNEMLSNEFGDTEGAMSTGYSIGLAIHGGGAFVLSNGVHIYDFDWFEVSNDLPMDSWFKMIFTMTYQGGDAYDLQMDIYNSDSNGNLADLFTSQVLNNVVNSNFASSPAIYPYIGSALERMTKLDNFVFTDNEEETLPVELSAFNAVTSSDFNSVILNWTVESETNHLGYEILRSTERDFSSAIRVSSSLITEGVHNGTQVQYQFQDLELESGNIYYYWLVSISLNGSAEEYGPISIHFDSHQGDNHNPDVQLVTMLNKAYPNPFNPSTLISYSLKQTEPVVFHIYNVHGQLIREINLGSRDAGTYCLNFDGKGSNGRNLSSGVYMYRMTTPTYNATRRFTLMK